MGSDAGAKGHGPSDGPTARETMYPVRLEEA